MSTTQRFEDGFRWSAAEASQIGRNSYTFEILSSRWSDRHGGRWFYRVKRTWERTGRVDEINMVHSQVARAIAKAEGGAR